MPLWDGKNRFPPSPTPNKWREEVWTAARSLPMGHEGAERWWDMPGIPPPWCPAAPAVTAREKLLNVVKHGRKKVISEYATKLKVLSVQGLGAGEISVCGWPVRVRETYLGIVFCARGKRDINRCKKKSCAVWWSIHVHVDKELRSLIQWRTSAHVSFSAC